MGCLHASDCGYRFLVLFFTCMLTFGSYFCFDMPSVLQIQFQSNNTCSIVNATNVSDISALNLTCCADCLGMSADDYNLLYAIYAWTNAVVVIAAGFMIDKLGNRFGLFLFSFLCLSGSSLFAAGAMLAGTPAMLPLMLVGRLVFGAGNGSLTVVQFRMIAFWFRNKELAMAFGTVLAFSRLGSVLNFLLSQNFAAEYGLIWTLWGGAVLCGFGFFSALIVNALDTLGVRQLGEEANMKLDSKKVKVTDVRYFGLQFWLLTLTLMTFYNAVFPFVADASKFIHDKYGYSETTSAYMAGSIYDVSMVLSPFLGGIVDVVGRRGIITMLCALLTLPVYGVMAFTYVHPLYCTIWLGFTYSFAAPSLWPSIPLVVSQATVGTANGIATSLQMIGIGICNLVVGQILGDEKNPAPVETMRRWKYVMIFLFANTVVCVICATLLIINDKRKGGVLNESRKERMLRAQLEAQGQRSHDGSEVASGASYSDSEPTEADPLLPRRSGTVTIN